MSTGFSLDSLVPARFLTLLAHLIVLILALWSRDSNVIASLPFEHDEEEYAIKDKELIVGLSLAIGAIMIEFIGFLSGVSMFSSSVGLLSIFTHGLACFSTSQWLIHSWQTSSFWIIFIFCSALPAVTEIFTMACTFISSFREF